MAYYTLLLIVGPSKRFKKSPVTPLFTQLVKELLKVIAAEWEDIGLFLHIEEGVLAAVKADLPGDCQKCFRRMLKIWLKQVNPPPTWSAIIEAIDNLGYESLAKNLKDKYVYNTSDN